MTGQQIIDRASYLIDEIGNGSISNEVVAVNTAVATLFGDLCVPQESQRRPEQMTAAYTEISVDVALSRLKKQVIDTAPVSIASAEAAHQRQLYQVDGVIVDGVPATWVQPQQVSFLGRYSLLASSSCNPYWWLGDGTIHTSPEPSQTNPITAQLLFFPKPIVTLSESVDLVGCEDILVAQVAIHFGVSARDGKLWEMLKQTER